MKRRGFLAAGASLAACTALRVSQCWYVRPAAFDVDRFTQGVGSGEYFLLRTTSEHSAPAPAQASTPVGA